jgi:hypothetical protein
MSEIKTRKIRKKIKMRKKMKMKKTRIRKIRR